MSSRGRITKRRGKATSASFNNRDRSQLLTSLFGERRLQDPNRVGSSVAVMDQPVADNMTQGVKEGVWTDNEGYPTASVLHALREGASGELDQVMEWRRDR